MQQNPYELLLLIEAAMLATLALLAWRRRPRPGAVPLSLLTLAAAVWSLGYALELSGTDLPSKLLWNYLARVGAVVVPSAWLILAIQYTGREAWLTTTRMALLAIEPLLTLLVVWTNQVHGLYYSSTVLEGGGPLSTLQLTYGGWFWLHATYSTLLGLFGTYLFVRALLGSPYMYRGQVAVLLGGAFIPWLAEMLYISGVNPFAPLDPTSFSFTFSGLAITWGLVRFRLLDIVPAARDAVIESMSDGIIVLDVQGHVVDLNPAAQDIVDRPPSEILGFPLAQVLPACPQSILQAAGGAETHEELALGDNDGQRTYDMRVSSLHDPHGRLTARLLVLRDITELKQAEEEIRQRSEELVATNVQLQETQEALVKAERLAAISQVAVTVAHEINNPLTPVLAAAQWLLSSGADLTAETREMVEHIEAGAVRIRDVVRRLQEIVDRPVPYVGETQMIDIHGEDEPPDQEDSDD